MLFSLSLTTLHSRFLPCLFAYLFRLFCPPALPVFTTTLVLVYYLSFDAAFSCCCVLGGSETNIDRARCFRSSKLGHWEEIVPPYGPTKEMSTGEPVLPQDTAIVSTMKVAEPRRSLVQSSEVFDEEINEFAQVHCENKVFEFELCNRSPSAKVEGNLRRNLAFWKRIGAPRFILNVIERGYLLPFLNLPEPAAFANNRSSLIHADFVEEAIRELVDSGRVVETTLPPLVVNPLSVSVRASGQKRLILDLRYVNKFLNKMHVKFEDWRVASLTSRWEPICSPLI